MRVRVLEVENGDHEEAIGCIGEVVEIIGKRFLVRFDDSDQVDPDRGFLHTDGRFETNDHYWVTKVEEVGMDIRIGDMGYFDGTLVKVTLVDGAKIEAQSVDSTHEGSARGFQLAWRPTLGDLVVCRGVRGKIGSLDPDDGHLTYYVTPIGKDSGDWVSWVDKAESEAFVMPGADDKRVGDYRFRQSVMVEVIVEFTGDYQSVMLHERNAGWLRYCSLEVGDAEDWMSFDSDLREEKVKTLDVSVGEIEVLDKI